MATIKVPENNPARDHNFNVEVLRNLVRLEEPQPRVPPLDLGRSSLARGGYREED